MTLMKELRDSMSNLELSTLETVRLLLNRLTKDDREPLFAIFSDPDIIEHYDVERFKKINKAEQLITYFDARFDGDTGIRWAIRDKSSGVFLGTCGFTHWNEFDYNAVVGYELSTHFGAKVIHQRRLALLSILFFLTISTFMCIVLKHSFYQAISH
jgi:ribosomal-protein-alanine N-acetyltransferase